MIRIATLFDLEYTIARPLLERAELPWEILPRIKAYILELGPTLDPAKFAHPAADQWIARSANVAPTASLNGPLIIDEDAEIRHCAYVRGSAVVGKGAVVGNSVELKNCVLFGGAQVPHFNYVGDSILGHKAHMGAGSVTSNVRSDKQNVVVHEGEGVETGLRKMGAMLGDFAEVGCNSVLNPGVIVGRNSMIYPCSCVRGIVPENCIYKAGGQIVPRKAKEE